MLDRFTTALALSLFAGSLSAQSITLTTEDYPPYQTMENGEIVGISVNLVREIMARSGVDYEMEMMEWNRAINLAQRDAETCVFDATQTPERRPNFQWVTPLHYSASILVAKAGSGISISEFGDLSNYRVGGQTGDVAIELLEAEGVRGIDQSGTVDQTLRKLKAGRIDLMGTSPGQMEAMQAQGAELETVFTYGESVSGMACSNAMDASIVARLQAALDEMNADGTADAMRAGG